MLHKLWASAAVAIFLMAAAIAMALEKKGAEDMMLEGGTRGMVPFPHHQHQVAMEDCNKCHAVFPQQRGVIEEMKARGELKPKQVMNKLCTRCHRQKKKQKQASGPTTCASCHVRE